MRLIVLLITLTTLSLALVACTTAGDSYEADLLPDEVFSENLECLSRQAAKYMDSDIDSTLLAETIGLACSEGLEEVIRADYPDAEMDFVNRRLTVFGVMALTKARNDAKDDAAVPANQQ